MIKLSSDLEKPCQNDIAHGAPQKHKIAGLGRIPKPWKPTSHIYGIGGACMGGKVIISSMPQAYALIIKADYQREIRQSY